MSALSRKRLQNPFLFDGSIAPSLPWINIYTCSFVTDIDNEIKHILLDAQNIIKDSLRENNDEIAIDIPVTIDRCN